MITAEQNIRAHESQIRRTVQLKRLLPEYELTQEKNLYKCLAIATDLVIWKKNITIIILYRYHTVLLKKLRPIHQKYKEIEENVKEQDQKLILLDDKNFISRIRRTSKIFETTVERQSTLNGTCAIASAFLTYLGPFTYGFRRLMLTVHWIKCIRDRGMTIVFDQISSIKGRIINWQLDPVKENLLQVNKIFILI
ncbi:unnamed protein product [Adineta steineri]|uniref:Uncharacterized protein n=1 Tax=Adineta steineri TaxID=433720 RepID=A0A814IPX9_9BILA|nr:unnamed protein product [Adineta steineri]